MPKTRRWAFPRRVRGLTRSSGMPLIETIDVPWGQRLIPVDELERFATEGACRLAGALGRRP